LYPAVVDPSWQKLSELQRQALSPLEAAWPAMTDGTRQRWLGVASRFHAQTHASQERMHRRMAAWSELSPGQRAESRLRYLQTARLSARLKRERWEAYKKLRAEKPLVNLTIASPRVIPPSSANLGTGATTVSMTDLFTSEPTY
jgi:hypothetical protein